jgi:hypothetical protein
MISTKVPTEEKHEAVKEEFYSSLEKVCNTVPNYNMKTILGNFNAKVEKKKKVLFISSMWRSQPSQQNK